MTPKSPQQQPQQQQPQPQSEPSTLPTQSPDEMPLKPCPVCEAPLSAKEMRERLQGSVCVGCTVTPPDPAEAGDVLFCSRSGKMLEPEDFLDGRAIRIGRRCFHLDTVREARRRGLQTGIFSCDCCGADIPARRLVRGKAKVIDKVVLCHKCYARDPDPAGNRREAATATAPEQKSNANEVEHGADAAPQEHHAQTLPALAATQPEDAQAQSDSRTDDNKNENVPVHAAHDHPKAAPQRDSNADSDSDGDSVQLQTDPMGLDAQSVSSGAEPMANGPFPEANAAPQRGTRSSRAGSAKAQPHVAGKTSHRRMHIPTASRRPLLTPPRRSSSTSAATERAKSPAAAATAYQSAAPNPVVSPYFGGGSREVTAMLGVMVLLVLVLCGMLLAVFLSAQNNNGGGDTAGADATAILAMNERLDRLVQQYGSVDQRLNDLERRLEAGAGLAGTGPFDHEFPGMPDEMNRRPHEPQWHDPNANDNNETDTTPDHSNDRTQSDEPADPEESAPQQPRENPRILALGASDPATRLEAVLDVHRYALYDAIPELIKRVRDDHDEYVRAFAIKALASFRAAEARDAVEAAAATDEHPVVQSAALDALTKLPLE